MEWTIDLATIDRLEEGEGLVIGPATLPVPAFIYLEKSGSGITLIITDTKQDVDEFEL